MKKRMICSFLVIVIVLVMLPPFSVFAKLPYAQIYVSMDGSDSGDGSIDAPFKTIKRAIDSVSYFKDKDYYRDTKIEIIFMDGSYDIEHTLVLDESLNNVTFKVYNNKRALFRGNIVLDKAECQPDMQTIEKIPLSARDKIKCIDVSEYVTDDENIPDHYSSAGSVSESFLHSEFLMFSDGTMMPRAKWPNEGHTTINTVYDSGANTESGDTTERPFIIGYDYENISNWSGDNILADGYGAYLWAYDKIKIDRVDNENKKIISVPFKSFAGIYSGAKLTFSNIIEELDAPGEWYIDNNNNTRKLYYYPNGEECPELTVRTETLLKINGAENIGFENIDFMGTRGDGIIVENSKNVVFDNCSISQIGRVGLSILNTRKCGIMNSSIHDCGAGGVVIDGGEKENLCDSNNFVENCVICRFSQVIPVYAPGIKLWGVGNYAKNNTIFDSWHTAVLISGNNNKLIRNEIFDVVNGSKDAGAVYAYCDSSSRGIEIKENYIHHLGVGSENPARTGVSAIYLDGWTSSRIIEKNVFYDCSVGINLNGGSDNIVNNNLFIDTPIAIYAQRVSGSAYAYWSYLKDKYFNWDVWHKAYPEIEDYDYDNTGSKVMKNVTISNNMRYNSVHSSENIQNIPSDIISVSGDMEIAQDDFASYDELDFTLTDEFYANNPQTEEIEFDKIGANITIEDNDGFALISSAPVVQYSMNEIIGNSAEKYVADDTGNNNLIVGKSEAAVLKTLDNGKNYIYSNYALFEPQNQQEIKDINGKITFEAWIKRDLPSACDTIFNIGDKNTYGKLCIGFEKRNSGYVFFVSRKFSGGENYWVADKICNYGEWVHLIVTYDDSSAQNVPAFYINGKETTILQVLTGNGDRADYDEDDVVAIGSKGSWKEMTNGGYGKIAIYDDIITGMDALRIYQAEKTDYELETIPKIVEYNMENITNGYILNSVNEEMYPLSVGKVSPGTIVAKNGRIAFEGNRCLYSPSGYYAVAGTDLAERLNGDLTISMWVKPNTTKNGSMLNVGEVNKFGNLAIIQEKSGNDVKFIFQRKFSGGTGYWATTKRYEIEKWYNIVVRFSDASYTNNPDIFINGSKVDSGEGLTPSGEAVSLTSDLVFSLGGTSAYSNLGSYFGDVVIYDGMLSESKIKELYAKAEPTYNYSLDAALLDNKCNYIKDYNGVNPEGLTIDIKDVNDARLFSTADDEDVSFEIEQKNNGVILSDIKLGYGKTYRLYSGNSYIEFTTIAEDYTVDYKLNHDNSISVYITNNTHSDSIAELYAAVYEDGTLVSAKSIFKGTLKALTEQKCDNVELLGINENTNISFIMVDGLKALKPLIKKIELR